jgi:hypothetical protein
MDKALIVAMLHKWIAQRPGLEFGNYGDRTSYRAEMRSIGKDLQHARAMLARVEWADSIAAEDILRAAQSAYSGRLKITEKGIDYCTGQYWPTEYRAAVCAVLSSALWHYWADNLPEPSGFEVSALNPEWKRFCFGAFATRAEAAACSIPDGFKHPSIDPVYGAVKLSAGVYVRRKARDEFGAGIARRWFN